MYSNAYGSMTTAQQSGEWTPDMGSFLTDLDSTVPFTETSSMNTYYENNSYDHMNFFPEQMMGMNVHSVSPTFSDMSSDKSDSGCYSDDSNSMTSTWGNQNYGQCTPQETSFCDSFAMNPHIQMGHYPQQMQNVPQQPATKKRRRRKQTPVQRGAANLRERKRMFYLNDAFDELKKSLPKKENKSRLSRIDTLKTAIAYIQSLSELLQVV